MLADGFAGGAGVGVGPEGVAAGVVFAAVAGATVLAGAEVAAEVPYQSLTPLCPLHAPCLVFPA